MTTKLKLILVAAMCATGFVALTATATGRDMYVKVDGIEGESTDTNHPIWIDVLGFSHGVVQTNLVIGVQSRGIFEPFAFKHLVDKATPKLQQACAKGSTITQVQLEVCRMVQNKQTVVYKVILDNVKPIGSTVSTEELGDGSFRNVEEVRMLAGKQTWKVVTVKSDGTLGGAVEATFDSINGY